MRMRSAMTQGADRACLLDHVQNGLARYARRTHVSIRLPVPASPAKAYTVKGGSSLLRAHLGGADMLPTLHSVGMNHVMRSTLCPISRVPLVHTQAGSTVILLLYELSAHPCASPRVGLHIIGPIFHTAGSLPLFFCARWISACSRSRDQRPRRCSQICPAGVSRLTNGAA